MPTNPIYKKKRNPGSASSSTLRETKGNGTSYDVQYMNGAQRTVNRKTPYYPPGYTPGGLSGAVSTRPNNHQKISAANNFGMGSGSGTGNNGVNGTPSTFTPSAYRPAQISSNYTPAQYSYTPMENAMTPEMGQYDVRDYNIRARENAYAAQMSDAINKLNSIGDFSYNQKNDPLYNQYAEMYQRNAKLAMQDTMGQAAALTGGYGSSYAETAGQAMYNQQMNQLNDKALELYNASLNAYNTNLNKAAQQANTMMQAYGLDQSAIQQELDTAFQNANLTENQRQYATQLMMNWAAEQNATNQFNSAQEMQAFFNNEQNRQQAAAMAQDADQFNAQQNFQYWNATNDYAQRANEQAWQNYWNNRDYQYKQASLDADNAYRYAALAQDADQYAQDNAYKYAALAQNQAQYEGDDAYRYAQLRETRRQNEADNIYRQQALQQDADQYAGDNAYRYYQLDQNQKQFDKDNDYRYAAMQQDADQYARQQAYNDKQAGIVYNPDSGKYEYNDYRTAMNDAEIKNAYRQAGYQYNPDTDEYERLPTTAETKAAEDAQKAEANYRKQNNVTTVDYKNLDRKEKKAVDQKYINDLNAMKNNGAKEDYINNLYANGEIDEEGARVLVKKYGLG